MDSVYQIDGLWTSDAGDVQNFQRSANLERERSRRVYIPQRHPSQAVTRFEMTRKRENAGAALKDITSGVVTTRKQVVRTQSNSILHGVRWPRLQGCL